ncbi:NADP-dependent malic enzyme [Streptomyces sp. NPDC001380]|uniref:NAD(P)-dependent malic enzyme n=1 Tax=Streptomyces sp. NPDC001380 TaxID=3364566 RepID=UPI003684718F
MTAQTEHASRPREGDPEADPALVYHRGGKLAVGATVPLRDGRDLALACTPGVADVCRAIAERPGASLDYTWRASTVAVVTDGTAVLGLGDIGPEASLPVMEGKAILFKRFGGVDAVPIALATKDVDEIVDTVVRLAPSFGGVNLEDISAPRCFEIERRLQEALDIPVFHDDQHGTAVVVLAALWNAARLGGRELGGLRAVVAGAGASGLAVARILLGAGIGDLVVCDSRGALHRGRTDLNPEKRELAAVTNRSGTTGGLEEAMRGADVFVGLSGSRVPEEYFAGMAPGAVVLALSNPDPEILPDAARRYASVVGTGRSDFPNQVNNVLAFPGIFAGALRVRASRITEGMKLAAARALADVVAGEVTADRILPDCFDERVAPAVTAAVAAAARRDGVARI